MERERFASLTHDFRSVANEDIGGDEDDKGCPYFCEDGIISQSDIFGELLEFDCPHCKINTT